VTCQFDNFAESHLGHHLGGDEGARIFLQCGLFYSFY